MGGKTTWTPRRPRPTPSARLRRRRLHGVESSGIPGVDVLAIARYAVLDRIALAKEQFAEAVGFFRKAATLQDTLPYIEPPYWNYPVRQSLAAALLQSGDLDAAEARFRQSLQCTPNDAWAYFGLAEVHKARGDVSNDAMERANIRQQFSFLIDQFSIARRSDLLTCSV